MVALSIPLTLFSLATSALAKQYCRSTAPRDAATLQRREQHIREMKARRVRRAESVPTTIPVETYMHVIRGGLTPEEGNVPLDALHKQMDVPNKDFAASPFVFNLTDVNYVDNRVWFERVGINDTAALDDTDPLSDEMMRAHRQGGSSTLNVYIITLPSLAGFASGPVDFMANPIDDGVVIGFAYLGGVTLSHEVGHWLGLDHTFEGGCEGNGDGVEDTYPHAEPSESCTLAPACPGSTVLRTPNIMDYLDDNCGSTFTAGQVELMVYDAWVYRNLWEETEEPAPEEVVDASADAGAHARPSRVSNRPAPARVPRAEKRSSRAPPRRMQA